MLGSLARSLTSVHLLALLLLRGIFHEPLGHRTPFPHAPRLCGCVLGSPHPAAAPEANTDGIATGILYLHPAGPDGTISDLLSGLLYFSISVSLNTLLNLMIVVQLILHGRNVRAATGPPGGISGLYKTIATMLIESSALFAVTSLLYIATAGANSPVNYLFSPILAEIQVRAFPRRQSRTGYLM